MVHMYICTYLHMSICMYTHVNVLSHCTCKDIKLPIVNYFNIALVLTIYKVLLTFLNDCFGKFDTHIGLLICVYYMPPQLNKHL